MTSLTPLQTLDARADRDRADTGSEGYPGHMFDRTANAITAYYYHQTGVNPAPAPYQADYDQVMAEEAERALEVAV